MVLPSESAPEPPPSVPPLPSWARDFAPPSSLPGALFVAGAALAALDPFARAPHPIGKLWRQRLALKAAAALVRAGGRTEEEAELRDHFYLTRPGDDFGPAGRRLKAFRFLGEPAARDSQSWPKVLPALFDLPLAEVEVLIAGAREKMAGAQNPVMAAAAVAGAGRSANHPEQRALALWLADAVLAQKLDWPAPVPLLAAYLRWPDGAAGPEGWGVACAFSYARAAAAANDLYRDLARRAEKLLAVRPRLRGKEAGRMVNLLLEEDAQPAKPGFWVSDRSARRLFDRLQKLGAVRELTGRGTARLYGL